MAISGVSWANVRSLATAQPLPADPCSDLWGFRQTFEELKKSGG
jgi:hypothetical protein